MTENEIAKVIVDAAYKIHVQTGPGLLINFGASRIKTGISRVVNGL
ncbi:MAG: hypothetical protein WAM60_07440 [Candidatus Promineifilaceae bacterium]